MHRFLYHEVERYYFVLLRNSFNLITNLVGCISADQSPLYINLANRYNVGALNGAFKTSNDEITVLSIQPRMHGTLLHFTLRTTVFMHTTQIRYTLSFIDKR